MSIFATALRPASFDQVYTYHLRSCPLPQRSPAADYVSGDCPLSEFRMLGDAAAAELSSLGLAHSCCYFLATVPLAQVAWCAASSSQVRRHAILEAVSHHGLAPGSTAYQLLNSWLLARPEAALFQTWHDYIGAIGRVMSPAAHASIRDWVLQTGEVIAECSANGFGLLGARKPNLPVLNMIERAFE